VPKGAVEIEINVSDLGPSERQAIERMLGAVMRVEEVRIEQDGGKHRFRMLICYTSSGTVAIWRGEHCECYGGVTVSDQDRLYHDIDHHATLFDVLAESHSCSHYYSPALKPESQESESYLTATIRRQLRAKKIGIVAP